MMARVMTSFVMAYLRIEPTVTLGSDSRFSRYALFMFALGSDSRFSRHLRTYDDDEIRKESADEDVSATTSSG